MKLNPQDVKAFLAERNRKNPELQPMTSAVTLNTEAEQIEALRRVAPVIKALQNSNYNMVRFAVSELLHDAGDSCGRMI